jgi:hypothetical protein
MHRRLTLALLLGVIEMEPFGQPPASKSPSEDIGLLLQVSLRQAPPISARREVP